MKTAPTGRELRGAGVVLVASLGWIAMARARPDWNLWLLDGFGMEGDLEGPIEYFELLLVLLCTGAWAWIATRVSGAARWAAVLWVVQLLVLLGEETDWLQIWGLRSMAGHRNLRMLLRYEAGLPFFLDAPALTAWALAFLVAPVVPLDRVRRWTEAMAPVRAIRAETLALGGVLIGFFATAALLPSPSVELLQTLGYAVMAAATARVAREVR